MPAPTHSQRSLESVLQTLLQEEAGLQELIVLALQEQEALITADYPAMSRIGDEMLAVAGRVEDLERERHALLDPLSGDALRLEALVPAFEAAGIPAFAETRLRLIARANELREAQERNARLILAAVKLQERWMAMFAALSSPTYAADGSQDHQAGRGFLSRSA
ncbi:MAG: flagellar protein FlgN [Dehalococcoidia bacterium]|nr:flagellar protein FlgN [Dehalococcoidia bacterium]